MPKRHGLFRWEKGTPDYLKSGVPFFLFGIHHLFNDITIFNPDNKDIHQLEFHNRQIAQKFLFSLELLQEASLELEKLYNSGIALHTAFLNQQKAEMATYSLFNYLSILTDNIGKLIRYIYGESIPKRYSFKTHVISEADKFSNVRELLKELENNESWWKLALAPYTGIRQRLIHYPDNINFQGEQKDDESKILIMGIIRYFIEDSFEFQVSKFIDAMFAEEVASTQRQHAAIAINKALGVGKNGTLGQYFDDKKKFSKELTASIKGHKKYQPDKLEELLKDAREQTPILPHNNPLKTYKSLIEELKNSEKPQDPEERIIYLFESLRNILNDFCDWLDRLEQALTQKLEERAINENIAWVANKNCWKWMIPVGLALNHEIIIQADDFLYLPVCEGSGTLEYKYKLVDKAKN